MNFFEVRETCDLKHFMIGLTYEFGDKMPELVCHSTYAVVMARLLGLSYTEFLSYEVKLGGSIHGKKGYPVVYFDEETKDKAEELCSLINKEAEQFYKVYCEKSLTK